MRTLPHLAALAVATVGLTAAPGCTVLASFLSSQTPTCESTSDCFAGFECTDGTCIEVATPTQPPIVPPASIDAEGGTVLGPDGVELIIPAGALSGAATVVIERYSATLDPFGVAPQTLVYSIRPALTLSRAATLRIPSSSCGTTCRLFGNTNAAFDVVFFEVAGSALVDGSVVGDIDAFGLYVAGTEAAPDDAGPDPEPDMPMDAGPDLDSGVLDAGPTLNAPCDLSPGSCNEGEACVPHPFIPGDGICLAPEGACDASCACCGPVSDSPGAPSFCLPETLCGAGTVGQTCAADDDCSPPLTEGCGEVGGGLACTARCTAATEAAVCGGGCCLPDADDPSEGWCAPAAACAQPTGALCLSNAACAAGTCASTDGSSPSRCTVACTLDDVGACGPDLCCTAVDCDGNGQCVPAAQCQGQGIVCTDTCLDDDACPDGLCDRGSCISAASCACLDHGDCATGERCLVDGATQTACEGGGDCCGTCVATVAPDCFKPDDCAPIDGGPAVCAPSADAGCADDPFQQCPGTCEAPSGACVVDEDCPGQQRCIQQECL
jgi:hypothetical protein